MMKIELEHYTELCYEGEAERTSVIVNSGDKTLDFKTKGGTSSALRACGTNWLCLVDTLSNFDDFEIRGDIEIVLNGKSIAGEAIFHSQEWWVSRVEFWESMVVDNTIIIERIENIAQKDWTNDERENIRTSREAVRHATGNLSVARGKVDQ